MRPSWIAVVLVILMNGLIVTRGWLARRNLLSNARNLRSFHASISKLQHDAAPTVDFAKIDANPKSIQFGDYGLIASQTPVCRSYVETKDVGTTSGPQPGDTVWLRGRVDNVRARGNACFIVLRSGSFYTIQACHFKDKTDEQASKALLKYASDLTLESIVDIEGIVSNADVKSCSQKNVEVHIRKIFAVSRAPAALPFLLDDAARPESEIEATADTDRPFVGVAQVRWELHVCQCGIMSTHLKSRMRSSGSPNCQRICS
jgi:hypothetical protein